MSRCAFCDSSASKVDDRTDLDVCASCARLPLAEQRRRLVWRATTDVAADDRMHERRIRSSAAVRDAMRRAALLLLVASLASCSPSPSVSVGAVPLVALFIAALAASPVTDRKQNHAHASQ